MNKNKIKILIRKGLNKYFIKNIKTTNPLHLHNIFYDFCGQNYADLTFIFRSKGRFFLETNSDPPFAKRERAILNF